MNRGEIRTLAAAFVEDPNQTKYNSTKYNDAIEKSQQQFAMDSKALYADSAITMVKDQAAYSLPTDFMYEKAVSLNGLGLEPISRATLDFYRTSERWDDDAGTPKYYIIDPKEASKTITLFPIPNSTDAGTSLVLTYYPYPAAMTADSDIPLNSSALMLQFHIGIAAYASWLLLMYLQQSPEIVQKRNELLKTYTDKINDAIQTFGDTKSEQLRMKGGRYWK